MTSKVVSLKLEKRTRMGKVAGRELRKEGTIPIEIYSKGEENIHAKVNESDFVKIIHKNQAGIFAIFEVDLEGKKIHTVIHDYQINALTDRFMHLDMRPIDMNSKITNRVNVKLVGTAPAVKKGGILVHNLHEIELEALPADFPPYIDIDVSVLVNFHDSVHVSDLKLPENVVTKIDEETLICHIEAKRGIKDEEETTTDTEAAEEGEESAEAETAEESADQDQDKSEEQKEG